MLECVILIGLPGAGKTSFYRERFGQSHVHITNDVLTRRKRITRPPELLDQTLASGLSAIVDNTNGTKAERADLIKVARSQGARVIGYFFDVSTRAAVARNANRSGKSKLPNVAIFTVAKRLEPPSRSEGFDELFRVEIRDRMPYVSSEM